MPHFRDKDPRHGLEVRVGYSTDFVNEPTLWTSPHTYYRTRSGAITTDSSGGEPVTLIVVKGGQLHLIDAQRYGLVTLL